MNLAKSALLLLLIVTSLAWPTQSLRWSTQSSHGIKTTPSTKRQTAWLQRIQHQKGQKFLTMPRLIPRSSSAATLHRHKHNDNRPNQQPTTVQHTFHSATLLPSFTHLHSLVGSLVAVPNWTWPQLCLLAIYVPSGLHKLCWPHRVLSRWWPTLPTVAWRPTGLYEIMAVVRTVYWGAPGLLCGFMGAVVASLTVVPHGLRMVQTIGPWCATVGCTILINMACPFYAIGRALSWGLAGFVVTVGLHLVSPNREQGLLQLQRPAGNEDFDNSQST